MPAITLPVPDSASAAHSARLRELVRLRIDSAGGAISFAEYMQLALYAPGLGYYSAGLRKFGAQGDFITAPEISPLFSRCLARQCRDALDALGGGEILEFGAGSGSMAAELLAELERLECLPERYAILEISPDLRARQQDLLRARLPHLRERLAWLERLPETPLRGVVLANEVLDAMPVARLRVEEHGDIQELCVAWQAERLAWHARPLREARLLERARALQAELALPPGYIVELNAALDGWLRAVAASLEAGLALLIDYGFPRREYYHPQRAQGTLMCHYRHYAHADPFFYPGLQDITAHVDFTAVADAALDAGLEVAGYTSQADFLLGSGLPDLLAASDPARPAGHLPLAQQAKQLIMPQEMGELFKVIALRKNLALPLPAFQRDRRARL